MNAPQPIAKPTTPAIRALIAPVTPLQQSALKEHGLTLEKIWITHGPLDHAGGTAALKAATGVPIEGPHPDDAFWIDQIDASGAKWGMPDAKGFTPDRWLHDGDTVTLGETEFE